MLAKGESLIENAAREPEIVDLASFLVSMGAEIEGAGTPVLEVRGKGDLHGARHAAIGDRIEAGTFAVAAAVTGGEVRIEGVDPAHLGLPLEKLREMGVEVEEEDNAIKVRGGGQYRAVDVATLPFPGFPTDMQPQMMALLSTVNGSSMIVENIFENRFRAAEELIRMGANIKIEGRLAIIEGVRRLTGTRVNAPDLRAGAALVVAGLMAEGETEIGNVGYIDRGYHRLEEKLGSLGAGVWRRN